MKAYIIADYQFQAGVPQDVPTRWINDVLKPLRLEAEASVAKADLGEAECIYQEVSHFLQKAFSEGVLFFSTESQVLLDTNRLMYRSLGGEPDPQGKEAILDRLHQVKLRQDLQQLILHLPRREERNLEFLVYVLERERSLFNFSLLCCICLEIPKIDLDKLATFLEHFSVGSLYDREEPLIIMHVLQSLLCARSHEDYAVLTDEQCGWVKRKLKSLESSLKQEVSNERDIGVSVHSRAEAIRLFRSAGSLATRPVEESSEQMKSPRHT